VWSEEATSLLQDCFEHTDWDLFAEGLDLGEYSSRAPGFKFWVGQCNFGWACSNGCFSLTKIKCKEMPAYHCRQLCNAYFL